MTEFASGNVFIRPNLLPRLGDRTRGHEHNFDHTTYVTKGGIHVERRAPGGQSVGIDVLAGGHCLIEAGVQHQITGIGNTPAIDRAYDVARELTLLRHVCAGMADSPARGIFAEALSRLLAANAADLADATTTEYHCIYSHRTPQGEVSEVNTGWPQGYI